MLLTGDFVFVGDVGRPDLLEQAAGLKGTQDIGAEQMYDSLNQFVKLEDYIQVWPGHGAGSACGKALGAVPMTTVGYEKIRNWAIKLLDDKEAFKKELLADQPEPPKYFAMMKKLNKVPRPLVTAVPKFPRLNQNSWQQANEKDTFIIDIRNFQQYAQGYWPSSINIANTSAFATYMGWVIPYDQPFALIGEENEMEEVARKLMRIGLDQCIGFITPDDLDQWEKKQLKRYQPVTFNEVKNAVDTKSAEIIDVRGASDYKINHIPGAHHLFYGTIGTHLSQVPNDQPVIVHCQTGIRAAIAHSVLLKNGFKNVSIYWGGMQEWMAKN
jgi:hydroxyacylglutathione hydrolase